MSTTIEVSELVSRFAEVLEQAGTGNVVIVTEGGVPRAKLVAIPPPRTEPRVPGLHPGAMEMAPDFDDPLPQEGPRVAGLRPGGFGPTPNFDDPLPDEFWLGES